MMHRRTLIQGTLLAAALPPFAYGALRYMKNEVTASEIVNGVAATRDGTLFVGMPRWQATRHTPSVARVADSTHLVPFPGGEWNSWAPGKDPRNAFVQVNSVHIFDDDSLWVVDQGAPDGKTPLPGAQKLVQFDSKSGQVLRLLRFDESILPAGALMNDLRFYGQRMYIADSGVGALIVHDLASGKSLRRLHQQPLLRQPADRPLRATAGRPLADGKSERPQVHADMLEISPDGHWLYFSTPSSAMYKIPRAQLDDPAVSDAQLQARIVKAFDKGTINGTCVDTLGNIYLGLVESRSIQVVAADGRRATLIADPRLIGPDALFIDAQRRLLIPATQGELMANHNDGVSAVSGDFHVYSLALPDAIDGIRLGRSTTVPI